MRSRAPGSAHRIYTNGMDRANRDLTADGTPAASLCTESPSLNRCCFYVSRCLGGHIMTTYGIHGVLLSSSSFPATTMSYE